MFYLTCIRKIGQIGRKSPRVIHFFLFKFPGKLAEESNAYGWIAGGLDRVGGGNQPTIPGILYVRLDLQRAYDINSLFVAGIGASIAAWIARLAANRFPAAFRLARSLVYIPLFRLHPTLHLVFSRRIHLIILLASTLFAFSYYYHVLPNCRIDNASDDSTKA